jgi:hypothetical protein
VWDCFLRPVKVSQWQYALVIARHLVWAGAEVQVLGVESLKVFQSTEQVKEDGLKASEV